MTTVRRRVIQSGPVRALARPHHERGTGMSDSTVRTTEPKVCAVPDCGRCGAVEVAGGNWLCETHIRQTISFPAAIETCRAALAAGGGE